jgi:mono/diheme cytochrome c family protein
VPLVLTRATLTLVAAALLPLLAASTVYGRPSAQSPEGHALPEAAGGDAIFLAACAACHGIDGRGPEAARVGFELPLSNGHQLPDFTDCATNTVEPLADWMAVAHRGGPVRALDRRMPAFGDALSDAQIESAIRYLWTFCTDTSWPRGDLNLPRALFTEKAFPENETVWTVGAAAAGPGRVFNELVYEHRLGARGQYEIKVPIEAAQQGDGSWSRGLGDIEIALRRSFYADAARGQIFAAGAAVTLPTGKEDRGLGNGVAVYEAFAMWGQIVGTNGFLQVQTGFGVPSNQTLGDSEGFVRTAFGHTVTSDGGFGRAWSPMIEVLATKPGAAAVEWDVVPQIQVSLSKLQHVLLNVGVRTPLNARESRPTRILAYLLWDWFDGGLFEFWK